MTYYRYKNLCHATLNDAAMDEFDDGVFVSNDVLYSPVTFHFGSQYGTQTVSFDYYTSTGAMVTVPRVYPSCTVIGYQSVLGLDFSDAVLYNVAIVTLWCIAYAFRSTRRAV